MLLTKICKLWIITDTHWYFIFILNSLQWHQIPTAHSEMNKTFLQNILHFYISTLYCRKMYTCICKEEIIVGRAKRGQQKYFARTGYYWRKKPKILSISIVEYGTVRKIAKIFVNQRRRISVTKEKSQHFCQWGEKNWSVRKRAKKFVNQWRRILVSKEKSQIFCQSI